MPIAPSPNRASRPGRHPLAMDWACLNDASHPPDDVERLARRTAEAEVEGEDAVRALYYEREDDFYTIVRPGGLTEDPPRGVSACELNQGDDTSGRVSREDVAAVCVECCKRDDAKNATFELYYRDTGKPMAEVFASNANKETDGERQMGPRGRRGETWDELFAGLEADAPGIPQKGEGFSL